MNETGINEMVRRRVGLRLGRSIDPLAVEAGGWGIDSKLGNNRCGALATLLSW
jgi:hypothetical protein